MLLAEQDRTRWDRSLIREAHAVLERAAMLRRPGRWQLHAAIAACHADAQGGEATDWLQVLTLYDMLLAYDRSPIVRLNRAVALAEIDGPRAALDEVDALRDDLSAYHLWHAVRARMLRGLGRDDEAMAEDLLRPRTDRQRGRAAAAGGAGRTVTPDAEAGSGVDG